MDNKIIDIENIEEELEQINRDLMLINDRLLALGMDFNTYFNPKLNLDFIYELRDNLMYRIFATNLHFKVLVNHINQIEISIGDDADSVNIHPLIDKYQQEIASILDSVVYHSISVYDYLGSTINFAIIRQTRTLKWSSLAKSAKDPLNQISKTTISNVILEVNKTFLDQFYRYRSILIHDKPDFGKSMYNISIGKSKNAVQVHFFAGKLLLKSFPKLKEITNGNENISIRFASFWLMKQNILTINKLLFGLKAEIENSYPDVPPLILYLDPITKKQISVSTIYWHEDIFQNKKM